MDDDSCSDEEVNAMFCWSEFLAARTRSIQAFHAAGRSDEEIAQQLGMDEGMVQRVRVATGG